MTANDDLRALVEHLDDDDAKEALADVRWLIGERDTGHLVAQEQAPRAWRLIRDERPRA